MSEAKEVSFTAKVMAAARALETQRPDALFSDFFAEQLAGVDVMQSVIPWLEEEEKQLLSIRTRFHALFCRLSTLKDLRVGVATKDPRAIEKGGKCHFSGQPSNRG